MKDYSDLDKILLEIQKEGLYSIAMDTPKNEVKAYQLLLRLRLIYEVNKNSYDLTEEGQRAVDMGGFKKWKKQQKKNELRDNLIKDKTLAHLNLSIFQLKNWGWILIISAITGFISGNLLTIIRWFNR